MISNQELAAALRRGAEAFLVQGMAGAINVRIAVQPPGENYPVDSLVSRACAEGDSLLLVKFGSPQGVEENVDISMECLFALDGGFARHECLPWVTPSQGWITFVPMDMSVRESFKIGPNGRFVRMNRRPSGKSMLRGMQRAVDLMMALTVTLSRGPRSHG